MVLLLITSLEVASMLNAMLLLALGEGYFGEGEAALSHFPPLGH